MKDLKISKELFEAVYNCDITTDKDMLGVYKSINLYEFAFKCKEWAKNKEYIVHSSPTQKIEHTAIVQSFDFNKFYYGENQFYALTEVEAIIKACEHILNEVNK